MNVVGPDGTTWPADSLRAIEHSSIRDFVERAAPYLEGRVLDYGCGKQPYRDVVELAGGVYVPFDSAIYGGNVSGEDVGSLEDEGESFAAILCTQVIQYVPPEELFGEFFDFLRYLLVPGGHLVMTYPTNWPVVESADLQRLTSSGVERLLPRKGFTILRHEMRAEIRTIGGDLFPLGYGVIARR